MVVTRLTLSESIPKLPMLPMSPEPWSIVCFSCLGDGSIQDSSKDNFGGCQNRSNFAFRQEFFFEMFELIYDLSEWFRDWQNRRVLNIDVRIDWTGSGSNYCSPNTFRSKTSCSLRIQRNQPRSPLTFENLRVDNNLVVSSAIRWLPGRIQIQKHKSKCYKLSTRKCSSSRMHFRMREIVFMVVLDKEEVSEPDISRKCSLQPGNKRKISFYSWLQRKAVQSSLDWLEKAVSTFLFPRQSEMANRFVLYSHKMRYLVEISKIQSETELSEWRPFWDWRIRALQKHKGKTSPKFDSENVLWILL